MSRARVTSALVGGLVAGTGVAVMAELLRPRPGPALILDWDEIARLAAWNLPDDPSVAGRKADLERGYARLAASVMDPFLAAVGGMPEGTRMPPFEALDRRGWVALNVAIIRRVLEPLTDAASMPNNLLVAAGRAGIDRYLGFILRSLSTRVLGQFDPQLLGREPVDAAAPSLHLVEPNIAAWEAGAKLPPESLRRWLILHEMTHAWQFAANPWLGRHLNAMLAELVEAGTMRRGPLDSLLAMTIGMPRQLALVRRMQTTMTMVEGYGNIVMNEVGSRVLPDHDLLEAAYRGRSTRRSPLDRLLLRLTGLGMKMEQYRRGEAFCAAIVRDHGMAGLNLAWRSAEHMPTEPEFTAPASWWARVERIPARQSRSSSSAVSSEMGSTAAGSSEMSK